MGETDLATSCTSSSSYSGGEESEDTYFKNEKQRQVRFERYAIIYGEDSPMPPSLRNTSTRNDPANTENSTDYSSSGANTTGNGNKKKSSKSSPEDSSSSLSSTGQSSSCNDRQKRSSTSLGSSSAITVGSRPTSSEDDQKGNNGRTEHPEKKTEDSHDNNT